MKWSIAALIALGAAGAVGAAVLVSSLRAGTKRPVPMAAEAGPVSVLYAKTDLPMTYVVDAGAIESRDLPPEQVEEGCLSDPVQVVGKVLAAPMRQGQAFRAESFVGSDSLVRLAAAVPQGMRAISLSLTPGEAMEGIVYPGSMVDVLASFRVPDDSASGGEQLVSMTLLKGVQLLAVENRTVVNPQNDDEEEVPSRYGRSTASRLVTLMVDPKQAELLQLAARYGKICLAMRNPMDTAPVEDSTTLLSQLNSVFRSAPKTLDTSPMSAARPAQARPGDPDDPVWTMVVIRGGVSSEESVPLPAE